MESLPCVYLHDILKRMFGKSLFRWFVYLFVSVCCVSCHFHRFMCLKATLWLTVTHTFMVNGPKLADWSKWFGITLWSDFCSLLTSNWEVSTSRLLYTINSFAQITQIFVISSYVEDIETNLPVEKHTLRVFAWYFEEIVGKSLFRFFVYVVVLICCISCQFYRFVLLNATLWLTVTHTFVGNGPKLADCPNESVLFFEVVFVVNWH